jgi:hypothetical protein
MGGTKSFTRCENLITYLCQKDYGVTLEEIRQNDDIAYFRCPTSPIERAGPNTSKVLLEYFRDLARTKNWKILRGLGIND